MPSTKREERTWVEIDLDAIANNYAVARSFLREQTRMIAVVKANAYGNGAPQVARLLEGEPGVYGLSLIHISSACRAGTSRAARPSGRPSLTGSRARACCARCPSWG